MDADALQTLWRSGLDRGSYSGEDQFSRRTGAKRGLLRQQVLPYLTTYTKFRGVKRPRVYNPYFVRTLRTVIQSDLIVLDKPKEMIRMNKGNKFILIVQDTFSRKIWTRALRNKQGPTILQNLREILTEMSPFAPNARFVVDKGTEYTNIEVRTLLEEFGLSIHHPSSGHAAHVERANLSLQRLLYQNMHEKEVTNWENYLQQATTIMNSRYHRIIRMSPNNAEENENGDKVNEAMSLYQHKALMKEINSSGRKKRAKYKVGDSVRLRIYKKKFERGYQPKFTDEVFKIKNIVAYLPVTMYELTEWDGTEIDGRFYPEELSLVKGDVFKIERIMRRAMRNGVPSAHVQWVGFPNKYNSWIPVADLNQ